MAIKKRIQEKPSNTSLFSIIGFKYFPYWPLFFALAILLLAFAFLYTRYLTPVYKINAALVINDEQKGVQESETLRSLNVYASNTTVENEIQVLTSRSLMKEVVYKLHLYAPVFEKGRLKPASAYLSSPVIIEARYPDKIIPQDQIPYDYDEKSERVKVNGRYYPLHTWLTFPFGVLRFQKNPHYKRFSVRELYFSLNDPRATAMGMSSLLEIGATSKLSSVITIQFTDEVPERGEAIVNALLDAYKRASISSNNQLAANTLAFVNDRIRDVESELDSIERKIQAFRSSEGIIDLSQQGRLYLENVAENDRQASEINTQLAVLDQVDRFVRSGSNRTGIVPTTLGISDPVLADLLQKLNTLELEYTNLRTRIGQENPMVRSVENEIQKIRPNILGIVNNQRARLRASLANYNRSSNQAGAMLKTIPGKERQLLDISRQQATKNEVYSFLLQRKEEAELSTASTTANSRVVDRAEASVTPVGSKRMLILVGALIAALALAIAYVFLKEGLTSKILFRSAIKKATSLPIVAELAYRPHHKRGHLALSSDPILRTQLLQLQAALGLFDNEGKKQRILLTSSINNEGKTFISNHLAISLASSGKRVVLLDSNILYPETTQLHSLKEEKGLSEFLQGSSVDVSTFLKKTSFNNLYLLPAGNKPKNASSLLLSDHIQPLFSYLEKEFDYIIIDSSPIELTTDAFALSRFVDQTLLVVRHGVTSNTLVQKLDENQRLEKLKNLSIVFNGIKARGFLTRYYGYGYGYGQENVFKRKAYITAE